MIKPYSLVTDEQKLIVPLLQLDLKLLIDLSVVVPVCSVWHTALHQEQSRIFAANITQRGCSKVGCAQHAGDK